MRSSLLATLGVPLGFICELSNINRSGILPRGTSGALLSAPMVEAELKIPVAAEVDWGDLCLPPGTIWLGEVEQKDTYLSHPSRNLAASDEALRVREEGGRCWLTYKGPKRGGLVKAREELEVDCSSCEALLELFQRLGFFALAEVRKRRRVHRWGRVSICFDEVSGLGRFVEIEIAEAEDSSEAGDLLVEVARRMGLDPRAAVTQSYLEMLLEGSGT